MQPSTVILQTHKSIHHLMRAPILFRYLNLINYKRGTVSVHECLILVEDMLGRGLTAFWRSWAFRHLHKPFRFHKIHMELCYLTEAA